MRCGMLGILVLECSFTSAQLIYHVMCMYFFFFCLHVYQCTVCMPGALGGQKRGQIPWHWSHRQV